MRWRIVRAVMFADQPEGGVDNPFWDYSLTVYARTPVAEALLALQDEFGLDVNVLLYAAWLADRGRLVDAAHLAQLDERVATWRDEVVRPLRRLRQRWRDYHETGTLRDALRELELRAEQAQQAAMWAFFCTAPPLAQAPGALRHNLLLAGLAAGPDPGGREAALARLQRALGVA